MKGRILGMAVAATLGIASLANAHPIRVGQISPPGAGLPGSNAWLSAAPLAVFSGSPATSGNANSMSAGDLATLVAQVSPVAGQVYVFAVESAGGASLVVLAGGTVNTSVLTNTAGAGVFQTGGVTISSLSGGGFSSIGTMNTSGGNASFAYVNMPIYTTGSVTLFGQNSAGYISTTGLVNFLSWDSVGGSFSTVNSQNMDGSMSFQFQVVPVPAPVALAGLGLVGAGLLRRRMAKN